MIDPEAQVRNNPLNKIVRFSQGVTNMLNAPGKFIQDKYIHDPSTGQWFPQGLISAKNGQDFTNRAMVGGLLSSPESKAGSLIRPLESPAQKTIGQMQQAHQIPELSQYENAMNTGNLTLADEISKKFPGDARFQIHKYFPQPKAPEAAVRNVVNPLDDFDHSVDLYKTNKGSLNDVMAAHDTIMKEAHDQLTPQELNQMKGNTDSIITLIQQRLKNQGL